MRAAQCITVARMRKLVIGLFVLGLGAGCQTNFTGAAHISTQACQRKCAQDNLQMAGMVYMGEYSSACLCGVANPAGAPVGLAVAGAISASPAVVTQMRRTQNQAQAQGHGVK